MLQNSEVCEVMKYSEVNSDNSEVIKNQYQLYNSIHSIFKSIVKKIDRAF